jgi:tRNA(fMet)-specific endonuclease VapC
VSRYILDTDHLTLLQHAHPSVRQHVAALATSTMAVTIITAEEQLRGWLDAVRQHSASPRQLWAYKGLRDALLFLNQVEILPFDQAAYDRFGALRQQKIRIGSQDLRIAAITLAVGGILVTRNQRDFVKVPELTREDWSIP